MSMFIHKTNEECNGLFEAMPKTLIETPPNSQHKSEATRKWERQVGQKYKEAIHMLIAFIACLNFHGLPKLFLSNVKEAGLWSVVRESRRRIWYWHQEVTNPSGFEHELTWKKSWMQLRSRTRQLKSGINNWCLKDGACNLFPPTLLTHIPRITTTGRRETLSRFVIILIMPSLYLSISLGVCLEEMLCIGVPLSPLSKLFVYSLKSRSCVRSWYLY